jgi:hypothetical protein
VTLTSGPHLSVTGAKRKEKGGGWVGGGGELGRCGPQARASAGRKAGDPAGFGPREKEREREGGPAGLKERRGEGERFRVFFF